MKILQLFLLFFLVLEIVGQRTRAPPPEQGTERATQPRGRGRTRFTATQEFSDTSDASDSGRRTSSRTRVSNNANRAPATNGNRVSTSTGSRASSNINTSNRGSNLNGNRAATSSVSRSSERRIRPTEPPRGYAVQEILNESPIDSFRRQSKSRVLTESRFDPAIPPRRATTEPELVRDEAVEEFVSTFGSTARAILSARGETPPPPISKTTTQKIDEEYLNTFGNAVRSLVPARVTTQRVDDEYLNTFGSTIRSIAASRGGGIQGGRGSSSRTISRNEVAPQRATPLRSETPILNEEDIPIQKSSLRDPLPSLRGSDSDLAQPQSGRSSLRSRTQDRVQEPRTLERYEPQRRVVEEPANVRFQPQTELPEIEQEFVELQDEVITEINSGEPSIEELNIEEQPEIITPPRPTEPPQSRRVQQVGGQRSNGRGRTASEYESQPAAPQRSRGSTTRENQRVDTTARGRGSRRYEDVSVAESRTRGPSVFAAEEYQNVNTRSRTGRRIGAELERTVDLSATTQRSRTNGRRATVAPPTPERYTNVDYNLRRRTDQRENPTVSPRRTNLVTKEELTMVSRRKNVASSNTKSRSRFDDVPPKLDEDKLEVLPLFDRESRVVGSSARSRGRSSVNRGQNLVDDSFQASATENDVRFVQKPSSAVTRVSVTRTQSVESRTQPTTKVATRRTPTTTVAPVTIRTTTRTTQSTTTTTAKPITRKAPLIRESVVAEYNEVTSKSTITRRKKGGKSKAQANTSRGSKKAEIKAVEGGKKKTLEEDVHEEDNYPEAFKALIQGKKYDKDDSRPSTRGDGATGGVTTAAKAAVTSSLPKSSPASLTAKAEVAGLRRRPQVENINDNEIELEPKLSPTPPSSTIRPTRKRQPTKAVDSKRKTSSNSIQTQGTNNKRKYTRQPPSEHKPKRKQLRSTAFPPSTTPTPAANIENKLSAKFVKKEVKYNSTSINKGVQNSKKNSSRELESAKPTIPFKKFNKYSSRYRNELTARSSQLKSTTTAPFYIPTIPTPAYVPTVPTITPPVTTVPYRGGRRHRDDVLELEAITFDEPVNTIASANLVKDGTTEKPVSIIERIINSITSISTTPSPNITTVASTKTADDNESSAILKLAPKKSNAKDKTRQDDKQSSSVIESITSEKPTTIIEKILSSLSAIQTNEVGTSNFNTVSSSSTTPLSAATKYSAKYRVSSVGTTTTLPAPLPLSTSINPLNVFDEIDENQVLEKQTIGKLLDILNGLASGKTSQKLVVVTPKSTNSGTTFSQSENELSTYPVTFVTAAPPPQEPLEALPVSAVSDDSGLVGTELSTVNIDASSSTELVSTDAESSTASIPNSTLSVFTDMTTTSTPIPETTSSLSSIVTTPNEILENESTTISTVFTTPSEQITFATTTQDTVNANSSEAVDSTTLSIETTTPEATRSSSAHTYSIPASLPTPVKFEVSPGSVSIISANDVSNSVTSDYNTVTIASRVGNVDNTLTTSTTTESSTTTEVGTTPIPTITTEGTTILPGETTIEIEIATSTTEAIPVTVPPTTQPPPVNKSDRQFNRAGRLLSTNVGEPVSNSIEISTRSTTTSTTPDYFVFAVLNNNTILRKKPPTIPNKEVPFVILGLYPNNTVVRKFPNGTLVPMEQIIKVRGFDTRPNPPPLPDITSNQVTDLNGLTSDDDNRVTVDRNGMPRTNPNPTVLTSTPQPITTNQPVSTVTINTATPPPNTSTLPTVAPTSTEAGPAETTTVAKSTLATTQVVPDISTTRPQNTTSPTIPPTLSELLNGKTLDALDNIIKSDPSSTKKPNYQTLTVNKYNEVVNIRDLVNKNNPGKPLKKENVQGTTVGSTPTTSTPQELFTSPIMTTEQWFSFPITTDKPISSTLISTQAAPVTSRVSESTTITESTTKTLPESTTAVYSTTTTPPTTTTRSTTRKTTVEPRIRVTTPLSTFLPSTILPTLFSTLFPTLVRGTTNPPLSSTKMFSTTTETTTTVDDRYEVLSFAGTTVQPTTVVPTVTSGQISQGISTTTQPTTASTESATTTKRSTTTTKKSTTTKGVKLKELTEEQKKNLEEIAKLEKQQADLLRQLNFLTSVFGGPSLKMPGTASTGGSGLANRVINTAIERDRNRSTAAPKTKNTTKRPNSIQDQLSAGQEAATKNETASLEEILKQFNLTALTPTTPPSDKTTPSLEDILKQYNLTGLSTPEPLTSTYGKSEEAILATLLKEQGIGPSTPKALADQIKEAGATTKPKPRPKSRPRTTTQRPGRLMQGLNWLLDLLDPPTTRRPATRKPASRKPKPKTTTTTEGTTKIPEKEPSGEEELLSHQPTRITPVVTTAPNEIMTKPELSQTEIRALIKQLEAIQKNPKNTDQLDFSKIKSLQNLLDVNEGVEVISPGQHGTTLRGVATSSGRPKETKRKPVKSTTVVPFSVSNNIEDEESLPTSTVSSTAIPPVRLNPVAGIDDDPSDPFIRSNLITAAVGVTRAISNFFGTAFQDAAVQVRHVISSGTNALSNISSGSSVPSVASASAVLNPSG